MGAIYVDTGGAATNSGSTDQNAANLSGTGDATVVGSVVTLTAGTDLSGVVTSGASQSTIYLAQATNTNQKIFWITATAGSGGATPNVTVSVAPTGVTGSNWAIGGRFVWTPASIEAGLRAGDVVTFNNSPANATADLITTRVAGSSAAGYVKFTGKTGTRPVLTVTNTNQCIEQGAFAYSWFENFELAQQGASGAVVANSSGSGNGCQFYNIKISDGGGAAIGIGGAGCSYIGLEITGTGAGGFSGNGASNFIEGCYIHDLTGVGIQSTSTAPVIIILNNIIDTCSAQGIFFSGATSGTTANSVIFGNTVYGCGDSGLEITDADTRVNLLNNIFSENGNAAGEYNVEWAAGTAEYISFHAWNDFYHSGGGGGANLLNLTVNSQVASSEFTTDPLFTNASGGDFSISSSSPAKATGYPGAFLGGSTGYLDMGAVQRQEPAKAYKPVLRRA